MAFIAFTPIPPAPVRDNFTFDFSVSTAGTAAIIATAWNCTISEESLVQDDTPGARIIGTPTFDSSTTSALCGDMIDGCVYTLQAIVTLDDGRVLTQVGDLLCSLEPPVTLLADPGWAQFDYQAWVARFPAFAGLDPDMAIRFWNQATLFHRNDGLGPVKDLGVQTMLLGLLTAHIAQLYGAAGAGVGGVGGTAGAPGSMVGRIASKSVGSVSLSSEGFPGISGPASTLLTTQYGVDYYYATQPYRQMRYVPIQRWPWHGRAPIWR